MRRCLFLFGHKQTKRTEVKSAGWAVEMTPTSEGEPQAFASLTFSIIQEILFFEVVGEPDWGERAPGPPDSEHSGV